MDVHYWIYGDPQESGASWWYEEGNQPINGLTDALAADREGHKEPLQQLLEEQGYVQRFSVRGYLDEEPWTAYENKHNTNTYRYLLLPKGRDLLQLDIICMSNLPDLLAFRQTMAAGMTFWRYPDYPVR